MLSFEIDDTQCWGLALTIWSVSWRQFASIYFFSVHLKFAPATGFSEMYPTSECHETTEDAYCNIAYNDQALITT